MSGRSHYDALGLQPSATKDEIREAFERLSSVFDADSLALYALVGAGEQEAEINRVREAHRVLADPEARRAYDESHGYTPDEIELGDADIVSSRPLHGEGSDGPPVKPHGADAGAGSETPADPPASSAALASVQPPAIPVATSDTLAAVQQLAYSPAAGSLIVSDPLPVEPPAAGAAFASEPPHSE